MGRAMRTLNAQVIVVTGASEGIGAALAERLGAAGAIPVLVARRAEALAQAAARCGPDAQVVVADMTMRVDAERVAQAVLARHGRVDAWVNNVGQGITRQPSALTDDDFDAMLRVNVKSAWYGVQAVLPHFEARGAGHLVNVSSVLGRWPMRSYRSAYSAAKAFLTSLTTDLRAELAERAPGVHVSLVSPGAVRTRFAANARHADASGPAFPDAQPVEEVADVLMQVLAGPGVDVYTRAGMRAAVRAWLDGATRDLAPFASGAPGAGSDTPSSGNA
jgi:short-subunit dehydrogenase